MLNNTLIINTVSIILQNYAIGFDRRCLKSMQMHHRHAWGFQLFWGSLVHLTCLYP